MSKTQSRPKTVPFSIRLTQDERTCLERQAGAVPLARYIRGKLLGERETARPEFMRTPKLDQQAAARILAVLGKSRVRADLKCLADLARQGGLIVTEETERAVQAACADIAAMKRALMAALGIKER